MQWAEGVPSAHSIKFDYLAERPYFGAIPIQTRGPPNGDNVFNAYDHENSPSIAEFAKVPFMLTVFIVGMSFCVFSADDSEGALVAKFFVLALLTLGSVGRAAMAFREARAKHVRSLEYFAEVQRILGNLQRDNIRALPSPDFSGLYIPKKKETVFLATIAQMLEKTEKVTAVTRKTENGVTTTQSQKAIVEDIDGVGMLICTGDKLIFVSEESHKSNWSKTWGAIGAVRNDNGALVVQPVSGKPKLFRLLNSGEDPNADASIAAYIITQAMQQ